MLRLDARRIALGLTLREVSNQTKIDRKLLGLIYAGRLTPSVDQAARLAKVLGVPAERLLDHVDERQFGVVGDMEHRMSLRDGEE